MRTGTEVDASIVRVVLPQAYATIDSLLKYCVGAPKDVVIQARKLLPSGYSNSLQKNKG